MKCRMTLNELSIGNKGMYGIAASAVPKSDDLYTYLRITDINDDGTLNFADLKSVDDTNADKYILKPNDIVFARTGGSTGRNYFYDGRDGTFVFAGFLIKFSINENLVNPKYIKYFCQSQEYKGWVSSFNTGSTRGNINAQTYGNLEIPLIPREKQDELVKILSSIDDKIELNNKINDNLEQQAQAIFKSWFVDFEPFGGVMPSDWEQVPLSHIAIICNRSFNPNKEAETNLEHYSIPAFDENKYPKFESSTLVKSNKFIIDGKCCLISKLNPTTKRIWKPYCISSLSVCSTEFIVYKAIQTLNTDYLYSIIDSDAFSDFMCSHVTGSTGSRQRTTPSATLNFIVEKPPTSILVEFTQIVAPLYKAVQENAIQIDNLKKLRDTLLPKLMSGEIDVSEVEE